MNNLIIYGSVFFLSTILNFFFWKLWNIKKINVLRSIIKSDRWGAQRVPLIGGIVIAVLVIGFTLYTIIRFKLSSPFLISVIGAAAMFVLGLIDDILDLKSYQKLLGQIIIILTVVNFGVQAKIFGNFLDMVLTFFWILGITNAFNILDNMDGLAGGIALIASIFLAINSLQDGDYLFFSFSVVLAAALSGFLIFNFKPAKVYLGDSGSLFIGFSLSAATVLGTQLSGKSLFGIVIFPVILLFIPIFDTVMVSITRNFRGQSPFQGGRDHLSHRLVELGMTERQAVVLLYVVSFLLGLSGLIMKDVSIFPATAIYFFISVFILLFGVYIGKIKITKDDQRKKDGKSFVIGGTILHKFRIFQVLLDVILLGAVYYFSYLIRFGGMVNEGNFGIFKESVLLVILLKIILLHLFGVYTIDRSYFNFSDAFKIFKGITIGSVLAIITFTFWYRFQGYSRAVFVIDWMLAVIVLGGVKFSYRLFDELFYPFKGRLNKAVAFLGRRDNYNVIESIFKLKSEPNYRLAEHIDAGAYEPGRLQVEEDIAVLVVEEKYRGIMSEEDLNLLKSKEIALYGMMDFVREILETGEHT